ncbi:retrovirus-related pol polyprotein from transposon TNT 1-94 [Tanacetum coccineum]
MEDPKTKMLKDTPYELLEDDEKKQLGKNNEAKMTLYNSLPQYEKLLISNEETIDSGFTRFNAIVTSLKSLDPDYSSKNHVRKFLRALPLKWRAKVMTIEEDKDMAILPLDELVGNLKVHEMILEKDGVVSKTTTKENVKSLALKAKVTMEQTSDNSDSQGGSDEDVDEEEAKAFNLMAINSVSSSAKVINSDVAIDLVMLPIGLEEVVEIALGTNEVQPKPPISNNDLNIVDLQKENEELLKFSKYFSKTYEKLLQEKYALEKEHSKLCSKVNELELEVRKLARSKEAIKPYQKCVELTQKVDSLKSNVSKLQDEALNFSKFKRSSIILDDMLSHQKLSHDKEGLGFSKNEKTTSVDDWIVDSGFTKHMTENRRLFTSFKAYDDGHVVFGSNLKRKVVGGVSFTKVDCTISKNGKTLTKGHRRNGLYTCKLGDKSKQQICLASMVDNSTLWHRRLGHANMWLVQNLASNELVRNLLKLSFKRHFCGTYGLGSQGNANNRTRNELLTTRVLELLHLDLFGPSPIQSYRDNFYTLMIVDDHLNYTWVVFVESKDDVLKSDNFEVTFLEWKLSTFSFGHLQDVSLFLKFMSCGAKEFFDTEGVVVLLSWLEGIELNHDKAKQYGSGQGSGSCYGFTLGRPKEVVDGRIEIANDVKVETNKIVRGCRIELEGHTFIIDLISFGHGSFDVIVGMDWLSKRIAKIVCFEKIVQIPLFNGEIWKFVENVSKGT